MCVSAFSQSKRGVITGLAEHGWSTRYIIVIVHGFKMHLSKEIS